MARHLVCKQCIALWLKNTKQPLQKKEKETTLIEVSTDGEKSVNVHRQG